MVFVANLFRWLFLSKAQRIAIKRYKWICKHPEVEGRDVLDLFREIKEEARNENNHR